MRLNEKKAKRMVFDFACIPSLFFSYKATAAVSAPVSIAEGEQTDVPSDTIIEKGETIETNQVKINQELRSRWRMYL